MKPLLYFVGIASIFDGILHLMFPNRWDAFWVEQTHRYVPDLGAQFADLYLKYPIKRRAQGLVWVLLGTLLFWLAGPVETTDV